MHAENNSLIEERKMFHAKYFCKFLPVPLIELMKMNKRFHPTILRGRLQRRKVRECFSVLYNIVFLSSHAQDSLRESWACCCLPGPMNALVAHSSDSKSDQKSYNHSGFVFLCALSG